MVEVVDAAFVKQQGRDGGALVVNVLPEDQYLAKRIPGSVNAPIDSPGFEERIRASAPDKDRPILVHCSGPACPSSATAARKLEAMGYTQVYRFKDGLEGWAKAGHDFESGGPERLSRPERGERPKRASTGLPLTGQNRP